MNRRVVLVSLDWLRAKDPRLSLGHASILARLASVPDIEVVSVARAVNAASFQRADLCRTILDAVSSIPTDIAIGVFVWNEAVVQWLLPSLRQAGFTGRILLGGPQISHAPPNLTALYPHADAFIRGWAEDALAALVASDTPIRLHGLSWHEDHDEPVSADLDLTHLASPILSGVLPVQPFMRWETQRGCPYACSFCQHGGIPPRPRCFALSRVLAEVDAMVEGGAVDIAILDPIFHANPAATSILGRFRSRGYQGRLSPQSRFERVDRSFLDACEGLNIRLEFGLQTTRTSEMRAIGRLNDLERARQVIAELHRRGIPFEVSLIYGLPTQTLASFEESVRWCREQGVPVIRAFPLMLLRGTVLDRERRRWALKESDDPIPVVLESDTFGIHDWERMRAIAGDLDAEWAVDGTLLRVVNPGGIPRSGVGPVRQIVDGIA